MSFRVASRSQTVRSWVSQRHVQPRKSSKAFRTNAHDFSMSLPPNIQHKSSRGLWACLVPLDHYNKSPGGALHNVPAAQH